MQLNTSTVRMMRLSTHLPKYPAMPPSTTPSATSRSTTTKPIISEIRPPYIRRVSTSMPLPSVPRGCSRLGEAYIMI